MTPSVTALAAILSSAESVNSLKAGVAVLSQEEGLAGSPWATVQTEAPQQAGAGFASQGCSRENGGDMCRWQISG